MKTSLKMLCAIVLYVVCSVGLTGCGPNSKRDRQKLSDASVLHQGTFKGYATVYVVDFINETYYRDEPYTEELEGYPVYQKLDGDYYIRYKGEKIILQRLDEEYKINYFLTLKWMLDYSHYIEDIPEHW